MLFLLFVFAFLAAGLLIEQVPRWSRPRSEHLTARTAGACEAVGGLAAAGGTWAAIDAAPRDPDAPARDGVIDAIEARKLAAHAARRSFPRTTWHADAEPLGGAIDGRRVWLVRVSSPPALLSIARTGGESAGTEADLAPATSPVVIVTIDAVDGAATAAIVVAPRDAAVCGDPTARDLVWAMRRSLWAWTLAGWTALVGIGGAAAAVIGAMRRRARGVPRRS